MRKMRRNPTFDHGATTVVIVTDSPRQDHPELFDTVEGIIRESGFSPIAHLQVPHGVIAKGNAVYQKDDRAEFEQSYAGITTAPDLEILLRYASSNKPLCQDIQGRQDLKETLWAQYLATRESLPTVHPRTANLMISGNILRRHPGSHLVCVWYSHHITSPHVQANGTLNYHMIGRGFIGFGVTSQIAVEGTNGLHVASINVTAATQHSTQDQVTYAQEVFTHEWKGHVLRGLQDHYGLGGSCVMSTRSSAEAYIQAGKSRKEQPTFCEPCDHPDNTDK